MASLLDSLGGLQYSRLARLYAQMMVKREALIIDICILTGCDRNEFLEKFEKWQGTQVNDSLWNLKWLSRRAAFGLPMPWDSDYGAPIDH